MGDYPINQKQAVSTPVPAPSPPPCTISNALRLVDNSSNTAEIGEKVVSHGSDRVYCDTCHQDVAIRWSIDQSGEQVHDIDAHDQECHYECPHCHDLVTNRLFHHDGPGEKKQYIVHDNVCTAQNVLFRCTQCSAPMTDEKWYLEVHAQLCNEAAKDKAGMKVMPQLTCSKDTGTGREEQKHGIKRKIAREHCEVAAHDDEKVERLIHEQDPLPNEGISLLSDISSQMARDKNRTGEHEVVFYCVHCGMPVTRKYCTWYEEYHARPCKTAATVNGTCRQFFRNTGKPKKVTTQDAIKNTVTSSNEIVSKSENTKPLHNKDTVATPATPNTSTSTIHSKPQNFRHPKVFFYCTNCGVPVTDRSWYKNEHIAPCKAAAMSSGTLNKYDNNSGLTMERHKALKTLHKDEKTQSTPTNRNIPTPVANEPTVPPTTTKPSPNAPSSPQQNRGPEKYIHCTNCGVRVTNNKSHDDEHAKRCTPIPHKGNSYRPSYQEGSAKRVKREIHEHIDRYSPPRSPRKTAARNDPGVSSDGGVAAEGQRMPTQWKIKRFDANAWVQLAE